MVKKRYRDAPPSNALFDTRFADTGDGLRPEIQAHPPLESLDTFNRMMVTNSTPLIELKSVYGISDLRDYIVETGTGSVSHGGPGVGSEYNLSTVADGDTARLESVEHGRYQPGYDSEAGIGVRLGASSWDGQARWGYLEGDEGLFFQVDSGGIAVCRLKGGTIQKVYQDSWNVDKLDGTGPSGSTLDLTRGNIFQVAFSWYGYGGIEFSVGVTYPSGKTGIQTVHRMSDIQGTTLNQPNLPISATLDASGSASPAFDMYVAGRQFSIRGNYSPVFRISSEERTNQTVGTASFVPLISIRKKDAYHTVSVKPESFEIITTQDLILELRVNPASLTGASFGTPTGIPATETAIEVDKVATAMSNGVVTFRSLAGGGTGPIKAGTSAERLLSIIPESTSVVLCAKAIDTEAVVTSVFDWREEW